MVWNAEAKQGLESWKVRWDIVPYTRGHVLDLGSGPFTPFPHFIAMDKKEQYTLEGKTWSPNIVGDATDLSKLPAGVKFDAVFSSHLLEHLKNPQQVLMDWWRVIKVGGHLVLYLPHKEFYPNVGEPGANEDHLHDFLPTDIIEFMRNMRTGWDLVVNEDRNEGEEYSFFQVYKKRNDKEQTYPFKIKRKNTCAVVRYGGIGDCMQASSVLPGLKKQGYHITFHTTPEGYEFLKHDPHIDDWWIQDKKQVGENNLRDFWRHTAKKYDKWVNLTEIVEATLLPMHMHTAFWWPTRARDRLCNINYMELSHLVAELPFVFEPRFYPSVAEKKWALAERKTIGKSMLWTISGSSPHKIWPYMDILISRVLLEMPDYKIILVGDDLCAAMIEPPWKEEPRVLLRSGKWSVRETLAYAQVADIVMGPETGILNSVAMMRTPKLVWLSHSSVENLTKHWVNTVALQPSECPCYPCHQLHYNFEFCTRDDREAGGPLAVCQVNIGADIAWEALCVLTRHIRREEPSKWQETQTLITQ